MLKHRSGVISSGALRVLYWGRRGCVDCEPTSWVWGWWDQWNSVKSSNLCRKFQFHPLAHFAEWFTWPFMEQIVVGAVLCCHAYFNYNYLQNYLNELKFWPRSCQFFIIMVYIFCICIWCIYFDRIFIIWWLLKHSGKSRSVPTYQQRVVYCVEQTSKSS